MPLQSEQHQDLELHFIQQINALEKLRLNGTPPEASTEAIHRISVVEGDLYILWLQKHGFSLDDAEIFCSVFMPYVHFRLLTSHEDTPVELAKLKKSVGPHFSGQYRACLASNRKIQYIRRT